MARILTEQKIREMIGLKDEDNNTSYTIGYDVNLCLCDDNLINQVLMNTNSWGIDWYLYQRLLQIEDEGNDRNNIVGDMGEEYVKYNLNCVLRRKEYEWDTKVDQSMTYNIIPQYGRSGRGQGGIDYYVRITDEDRESHVAMIEVSNWKNYDYFSESNYQRKINSKFDKYDEDNSAVHISAITEYNVKMLEKKFKRDNIAVLPIRVHITPEWIHMKYDDMDKEDFPKLM